MTVGTTIDNPPVLPKQMKHWFAQIGVRPGRDRHVRDWFYGSSRNKRLLEGCIGQRRHFRVLPHLDRMDICDGDMDRWANSMGASISPIPRTASSFSAAVEELLKKSAGKIRDRRITDS